MAAAPGRCAVWHAREPPHCSPDAHSTYAAALNVHASCHQPSCTCTAGLEWLSSLLGLFLRVCGTAVQQLSHPTVHGAAAGLVGVVAPADPTLHVRCWSCLCHANVGTSSLAIMMVPDLFWGAAATCSQHQRTTPLTLSRDSMQRCCTRTQMRVLEPCCNVL